MFEDVLFFIRSVFKNETGFIPLHAPHFGGNEKKYLLETIDSTFVSSVGEFVNAFEREIAKKAGAKFAIATVNGTTALQLALIVAGVESGDEIITQPLTFVATANAISHANATPVFVDVDKDTMGLSPAALNIFLEENAKFVDGYTINKSSGKKIAACIPMHTFGFSARIDEIKIICEKWGIALIEDAAESLGSYYKEQHTGTFGVLGTFSFNGNKTITCGGGGAIITNNETLAIRAKHLSTTAKIPHAWEFSHDEVGYNYRMPNLNAALACAQLEQLDTILANKKELAKQYEIFFSTINNITFFKGIEESSPNYWLNTIIFNEPEEKESFLVLSNNKKVMTRPIWQLMNRLPMYKHCQCGDLSNAIWLESRVVNIPSSFRA